ncbi:MAG: tetratricopeptide repeat protein [Ilyomonas sp.]
MFVSNTHIQRARLLLSQGRIKDAEKEIGYALNEDPDDDEALMILAECKLDSKNYTEALSLLKNCIAVNPANDRPYYLMSFCHYRMHTNGEAISYIKQALYINPYFSAYYGLYAYILLDMKRYEEALNHANEGLAINAEDLTCLNARSQALFRLKNKEEAFETIKEALAIDPEDDFTHTNYAWHFLEKGKHKDARKHFREALRINPNNSRARQGYKESLKSNLPPYRWMLMFSLWLSSKSKKVKWATIIVIWLVVRLLSGASDAAGFSLLAYILVGLYLLFVIFSWVGTSLANLMLLFNAEGKFVLTSNEKKIAAAVGFTLLTAILVAVFGSYLPTVKDDNYLFSSLIILTLLLPLSRMENYTMLRLKKVWFIYTIVLLVLGCAASVALLLTGNEAVIQCAFIYLAALAIYTWGTALT